MTAAHKDAMAAGRAEGRVVKTYLDALQEHRPRRGRRRQASGRQSGATPLMRRASL